MTFTNSVAALSSEVEPQKAVKYLNIFCEFVTEKITQRGGMVSSFEGASVTAAFGALNSIPDAALVACEAAFAIQNSRKELNSILEENHLPSMAIGIGISTGPAFCGPVGSVHLKPFRVIGGIFI